MANNEEDESLLREQPNVVKYADVNPELVMWTGSVGKPEYLKHVDALGRGTSNKFYFRARTTLRAAPRFRDRNNILCIEKYPIGFIAYLKYSR